MVASWDQEPRFLGCFVRRGANRTTHHQYYSARDPESAVIVPIRTARVTLSSRAECAAWSGIRRSNESEISALTHREEEGSHERARF